MSAEVAKKFCWPQLSPIQGWGSLTVIFIGKFVYMAYSFDLLLLNPFDLRVDLEECWFEPSMS